MAYLEDLRISNILKNPDGLMAADPLPPPDQDERKRPDPTRPADSPYLPGKSPAPSRGLAAAPDEMQNVTVDGFFLNGDGDAYYWNHILNDFIYDGEYDIDKHGMPTPLGRKGMQVNPDMAHAEQDQYYTEDGDVTSDSPYKFNRNTTELEVPWLKDQYYDNLPQYKQQHMKIYHGKKEST